MQTKIIDAVEEFEKSIVNIGDLKGLEEFRIAWFGKKGEFTLLFDEFKTLPKDERPAIGKLLNINKGKCQKKFDELKEKLSADENALDNYIDLSLPGRRRKVGSRHILIQTLNEIKAIFQDLGFSVYDGPELESDYYNFEMLNFPPDHPARDMQDTYFITEDFLMRTHTSPVQVRLMKEKQPPLRAIMPGKVYRNEAISMKSYCLFHQVEGLYVDLDVSFAELKGTILFFVRKFFGEDVKYRFRPSFFPFTEPSAEVDIWWQPKGKSGRWLEIMGCGMVDPNVLKNVDIDPEEYTGYAFGMGVERIALRKYGINDIRTFFDNDKRFLEQF